LSLSLNVLWGYAGQISFGHAAFYAIGAYSCTILQLKAGLPFSLSVVLTLLICAGFALAIGYPVLRLKEHYLGMATLAIGLFIYSITMQWVSLTGGPDGIRVPFPTLFGVEIREGFYYIILICLFLIYLLCKNIEESKLGLIFKCIKEEETATKSFGVNITKYKILAFTISSLLAGIAGILFASLDRYLSPEVFSLHTSILILTMVIVGGSGSNLGAVLGAILIIGVQEFLHGYYEYQLLVYGAILLGVIVFLPQGIISIFQLKTYKLKTFKPLSTTEKTLLKSK